MEHRNYGTCNTCKSAGVLVDVQSKSGVVLRNLCPKCATAIARELGVKVPGLTEYQIEDLQKLFINLGTAWTQIENYISASEMDEELFNQCICAGFKGDDSYPFDKSLNELDSVAQWIEDSINRMSAMLSSIRH